MSFQETSLYEMERIRGDFAECGKEYRLLDYLGSGAYGTVCSAMHVPSSEKLAIKKCKNVFKSRTIAKRTLREVRILRYLSHPNIIVMKGLLPTNDPAYDDLYLLFELMETDLSQIIRSPQELCIEHVQYFMSQLFSAVAYLHDGSVVHRDIKPKNIMVNADCTIKLADFGLARVISGNPWSKQLAITDYVTTRWYRAPEVLAGWSTYGYSVDMWALGCILVELINRAPLFPGSDSLKQLEKIVAILGKPEQSFINKCLKYSYRRFLQALPAMPGRLFKEIVPNANTDALDLAERLLVINPSSRLSGKQCLEHRFIAGYLESNGLELPTTLPLKIPTEAFDHELVRCELDVLRREIGIEIGINAVQLSMNLDLDIKPFLENTVAQSCRENLSAPLELANDHHPYQSLADFSNSLCDSDEEEENKSVGTEVLHYTPDDKQEDMPIQACRMMSSSTVQTIQEDYMVGLVPEDEVSASRMCSIEADPHKLSPIVENSNSEKSSSDSAASGMDRGHESGADKIETHDDSDAVRNKASYNSLANASEDECLKEEASRRFSFSSLSSQSFKRRMSAIRQQAATAECEVCSLGLSFLTSRGGARKKAPAVLTKLVIPRHQDVADMKPSQSYEKTAADNSQAVAKPSRSRNSSCAIM